MFKQEGGGGGGGGWPFYRLYEPSKPTPQPMWDVGFAFLTKKITNLHLDKYANPTSKLLFNKNYNASKCAQRRNQTFAMLIKSKQ